MRGLLYGCKSEKKMSIVRISIFINMASNILLLASRKYVLTSQGLVGAGMNCRAL